MKKSFRIKFILPCKVADKFEKVKNKPRFIAEVVEWYLNFGEESLEILKRIEAMLLNRNANPVNPVQKIERDSVDDDFDKLV